MTQIRLPENLYSASEVRELDRIAIESRGIPGLTLMKRAAAACVDVLLKRWPTVSDVFVFCGSGNNAGDGYIVAGMLAEKGLAVSVLSIGETSKLSADATAAFQYCQTTVASFTAFSDRLQIGADAVIVDALLGTGASGEVRPAYRRVIDAINGFSAPVLAVDIPSGLNADTGVILGTAVAAATTVSFIGLKQGLFTLDGPGATGDLVFASLDVPADIYSETEPRLRRLSYRELIRHLPGRPVNAHKNQFGHVLVVGGNHGMGGAAAMAAEAALRSGAGLVSVATHESHAGVLMSRRPELMIRGIHDETELVQMLAQATVVVLGPGLGRDDWAVRLFEQVVECDLPMVVDADGLNLLASAAILKKNWILTPHPGEAARLLETNPHFKESVRADRFAAVCCLQQQYGGVALLKGAGTLIKSEQQFSLCGYGNPGMSSAGMGDVLSGVIGGLLAQACDPYYAAQLGTVVHSLAADQITAEEGQRGLMATDLLPEIRRLLNGL